MIPLSSEIIAVSNKMNVRELIKIYTRNITNVCLVIDEEKEVADDILLVVDLINLTLSFEKKPKLLENKNEMINYLNNLTLKHLIDIFGGYKKSSDPIFWSLWDWEDLFFEAVFPGS